MYEVFHSILADRQGGAVFSCFGAWHWCCIAAVAAAGVLLALRMRSRGADARKNTVRALIHIAFGLYVADFFLMPLAFGEIDIEKLPFHVCTAMCVMCFLSYHSAYLGRYRIHFALLGFLSNLIYLLYPAGVMWYQVHPLCYRVIQTLLFHGCMTLYGLFELMYGGQKPEWKTCRRDLGVTVCMTLWALLGNTVYNGRADGYDHFFNWFFVKRDPFYLLPGDVAPYVMPFLNIAAFFAVELLVYAAYFGIRRACRRQSAV